MEHTTKSTSTQRVGWCFLLVSKSMHGTFLSQKRRVFEKDHGI